MEVAVEAAAASRVAEAVSPRLVERTERVERGRVGVERVDALQEPVSVVVGRESVDDPTAGTAETDSVYTHLSLRSSSGGL